MVEVMFVSSIGFLAVAVAFKVVNDSKRIREKSRAEERSTIVKYTFER